MEQPNNSTGIVQIISVGKDYDRIFGGINEFYPMKVYFLINTERDRHPEDEEAFNQIVNTLVNKWLPLLDRNDKIVKKEIDQLNMTVCQTELHEIVEKEKSMGNKVIFNVSTGATPIRFCSLFVSLIMDCEVMWVMPEIYGPEEKMECIDGSNFDFKMVSYGVKEIKRFKPKDLIPYPLPSKNEKIILLFLEKRKEFAGTLLELSNNIEEEIGSTDQAKTVKMSEITNKLLDNGFIKIEKGEGRKRIFKITPKGELAIKYLPNNGEDL